MRSVDYEIEDVATAIDFPVSEWTFNCYSVACKMVEAGLAPGGTAVYGHWIGSVARASPFYAGHRATGFSHHGWVLLDDEKTVVDPTRWVFENAKPYIFRGEPDIECWDFESDSIFDYVCMHCGHVEEEHLGSVFKVCQICLWPYDEGGNRLRERYKTAPPHFDCELPTGTLHVGTAAWKLVDGLYKGAKRARKKTMFDLDQLRWLATLPYDDYGTFAKEIYDAIEAAGVGPAIPIDNRRRADRQRSHARSCRAGR